MHGTHHDSHHASHPIPSVQASERHIARLQRPTGTMRAAKIITIASTALGAAGVAPAPEAFEAALEDAERLVQECQLRALKAAEVPA